MEPTAVASVTLGPLPGLISEHVFAVQGRRVHGVLRLCRIIHGKNCKANEKYGQWEYQLYFAKRSAGCMKHILIPPMK
jgi:hypothetical protein